MRGWALALLLLLAACGTPRSNNVALPIRVGCMSENVPPPPGSYPDDDLPTAKDAAADRYRLTAAANQRRKARLALLEPVIAACR